MTSPPYWSLRDYGVEEQIGRVDDLSEYVASIVKTFEKMKHFVRRDGTVWLNLGDSYTSGSRRYRAPDRKNRAGAMRVRPPTPGGLEPKDLIGVPWRLAFALQGAGWWLRSEVIWSQPNAHPDCIEYFGLALAVQYGATSQPLGLTAHETVFRHADMSASRTLAPPGSSTQSLVDLEVTPRPILEIDFTS